MKVLIMVIMLLSAAVLPAVDNGFSLKADSLRVNKDSINVQIQKYQEFRENKFRIRMPKINAFTLKYEVNFFDYKELMDHEIYQISNELYNKYYARDILLWNYQDSFYLSMNIKDMQSKRGLLKVEVPLSNFPLLFRSDRDRLKRDPWTHK
ncbi:MAG: hypothetical protein PHI68_03810 [Candidatus Cloacimonetes bacterium]|nr:hypothetical protein [Candidatus Cloacimonadota bacterium]